MGEGGIWSCCARCGGAIVERSDAGENRGEVVLEDGEVSCEGEGEGDEKKLGCDFLSFSPSMNPG